MEEKKYPIFEEEEGIDVACEPMSAVEVSVYGSADNLAEVHNWVDEVDWSHFPNQGPFSEEDAVARIDDFENRLEKGQVKWISSKQAWEQLYSKYPWLR